MKNKLNYLNEALQKNHILVSKDAIEKLINYLELLQKWNRVFNLTSINQFNDMVYLHIIDCLIVNPILKGTRYLDVGSGAGLPGIPLAIINPSQYWTLLDKNSKKIRFLTQVTAELGLKNVTVIHGRCEDFHPSDCFDTIISRAFASINAFVETTSHLLCPNGIFIAMKGKYPEEELTQVPDDISIQNVMQIDIKGINIERHLVCLQKK